VVVGGGTGMERSWDSRVVSVEGVSWFKAVFTLWRETADRED